MLDVKLDELRKIGEGREAEMYEWADGKALRLLRRARGEEALRREATMMEAARAIGVPVPAVYEMLEVDGRAGMIVERVDGPDLLTLVGKRPWAVFQVARVCGEIHARMHSAAVGEDVPPLRQRLELNIRHATSTDVLPQRLADMALERLSSLADGDRLCHGDYHPANVMENGGRPVVIDWPNATRGEAEGDVARSMMMIRMGAVPPGEPFVTKALATVGRRILWSAYVRSYRRVRELDTGQVAQWLLPVVAARLAEGIGEETKGLLAYLEKQA